VRTDLVGANLQEANLQGVNLDNADLAGATMPPGSEMYFLQHISGL